MIKKTTELIKKLYYRGFPAIVRADEGGKPGVAAELENRRICICSTR